MSAPVYYPVEGDVLPHLFGSYDSAGASATLTGLAVTDIEIVKDGGTTQRASDNGYTLLDTDGIDFDGVTGIHGFSIDLNDNSDAGFYEVGPWYHVLVSSVTIDGQTVSFVAFSFRIVSATRGLAGTALPAAAADAAGGLPVSDAGGLDLDAKLANTHEITAARMGALTDWIDGNRLDLILDARASQASVDTLGTAAEVADAVWDEDATGHQTSGTFGKAIGDPGLSVLTIHSLVSAFLDDTISSRSSHSAADVWASGTRTLTALDAAVLATDAVEEIRNAITGGAYALNTDSGGNVKISDGTGANQLSLTSGLIDGITGTIQTLDALDTAQDVEHDATQAAIAALNNLSAAQVNAEVVDALNVDTYSLPGQITPSTTPTLAAALMQLFQLATNPSDQTATLQQVYNRAGAVVHQKRTVGESGGTASLGALVTGP